MTPETFLRWLFAIERPPAIDDWAELERWLEVLQVGPLAYATVRKRGDEAQMPAPMLDRLKQRYLHQSALSLELLSATDELKRRFAAEGVSYRLLKGGALFDAGIYDDPGVRYTQDIDLLIDPRDAKKAGAVLESLGYVTSGIGGAPKHLPPYYRGRVAVELHEWAYWDARGKKVGLAELEGESLLGPTVVHLVHHLCFTSPFEPWLLVRTLQDLRELGSKGTLSDASTSTAIASAATGRALLDLRDLLATLQTGRPLSDRDAALLRNAGSFGTRDPHRATLRYYVEVFRQAPSWYVSDMVRATLVPNRTTLAAIYGIDERSLWLGAWYLLRPFHLGVRGVQALLRRRRQQ